MSKKNQYDCFYVDREEHTVIGAIGETDDKQIYITFLAGKSSGLWLYNQSFDLVDVVFAENRTTRKPRKWK